MELSEKLFTELTGVMPSAPAMDAASDRRRHQRFVFGLRGRIMPLFGEAAGGGLPAMVRDISRSGIGLLFSEELTTGDEFIIQLPRLSGPDVQIQCMVKRCESGGTGGGNFVVGAAFELVLDTLASNLHPVSAGHCFGPTAPSTAAVQVKPRPRQRDHWLLAFWKGFSTATRLNRSGAKIRRRLRASRPIDLEKKFGRRWHEPEVGAKTAPRTRQATRAPAVLTPAEVKAAADFWA